MSNAPSSAAIPEEPNQYDRSGRLSDINRNGIAGRPYFVLLDDYNKLRAYATAAREKIADMEKKIHLLQRDRDNERRDAATEAMWRERQGDDYGSY